ncbi:MAG TPA: hypothetical protein VN905_09480 [Candidatus Binatia bacterium]|nr:hypothetical protein [Candidatus Binatia bacterium]
MKASVLVLAAAFLVLPSLASAQATADPSAAPAWIPIDNCPAANLLGPQVYSDVQAGTSNAAQEVALLASALRMCQTSAPPPNDAGPSQQPRAVNSVLQTLGTLENMYLQYRSAVSGFGGASSTSNASTARSTSASGASPSTLSSAWSYASTGRTVYRMSRHAWRH